MLKLKTLITEQEFKAKSKETGRVVVYKSKDSMDKAIKGGKAEPLDKKTSGKPEKTKGASLFKTDKPKSKKMPSGIAFTPDGKKVFGAEISSVDDLKNAIKGVEGRVDLQIFDANISDEFNDSLYIQDGKLMFTDVFGDEEEITDEETLEALKDVIEDEGGLEVQKTEFEKGDKIKSKTSFHFAKDVKKIKGSYDLGGVTIKDGKMFNADGEEMDEDDIEDFYYQEATDEQGNEVGVEVFKKFNNSIQRI
jgi:hypothetical protein